MAVNQSDIQQFLQEDDDFAYEEDVLRNPYETKSWWTYIQARRDRPAKQRNVLYERALKHLPGSYKLWYHYLLDRQRQVRGKKVTHALVDATIDIFERALVFMHKMPRIWLEYCSFLARQQRITATRRAYDRALQALPITQHARIWEPYSAWVKTVGVWETAVRVFRRYLRFDENRREEYVDYLLSIGHHDEAANQLAIIANDDDWKSKAGRSRHQIWMQLCDLISKHPTEIKSVKVEPILKAGLRKFTDEVGRLWCALADYYIRLGQFEKARDIYEEGMEKVITVRDFSMIFDAYAQFEETILSAKMDMAAEESAEGKDGDDVSELMEEGNDVNLRLARLEHLMDRRPLLLSSVLLRQNPHNVHEWHKRAQLFEKEPRRVITTYTEAVKTVDPWKALGKTSSLWVAFAKYYEKHGDLRNARIIFEKATKEPFRTIDDLANIWCEYAEMELRHKNYKKALEVMETAVKPPSARKARGRQEMGAREFQQLPVQDRVYKSVKLWSLYLDLEENVGTLETARAAYDACMEHKVATPQIVLNYASMLEERKYFEESFKVYERGVDMFRWPHVREIWAAYLTKFVARYGGMKIERARDLFEQCVDGIPAEEAKTFYLLYAKLEEEHGLIRHAMSVYDRATQAVKDSDKFEMYVRYIRKVEDNFGITKTRPIYEKAIEDLPDDQVKDMCLRFAAMERKLGEIDRARAILAHAAQFCDPRTVITFWKEWKDFELAHGNEDTYREMLRVKRSVAAQYTQVNYMTAEMKEAPTGIVSDAEAAVGGKPPETLQEFEAAEAIANPRPVEHGAKRQRVEAKEQADAMAALEAQTRKISERVKEAPQTIAANPDEIQLDEDEDEDEDDVEVKQKAVPSTVFGTVDEEGKGKGGGKALGALERLQQAGK